MLFVQRDQALGIDPGADRMVPDRDGEFGIGPAVKDARKLVLFDQTEDLFPRGVMQRTVFLRKGVNVPEPTGWVRDIAADWLPTLAK